MGRWVAMIAVLAGCGMPEPRFDDKVLPLYCEQSSKCTGVHDVQPCLQQLDATSRKGCDYDPAAAKACFRALKNEQGNCVADDVLGISWLEVPEDCDAVWTGECALDVGILGFE